MTIGTTSSSWGAAAGIIERIRAKVKSADDIGLIALMYFGGSEGDI